MFVQFNHHRRLRHHPIRFYQRCWQIIGLINFVYIDYSNNKLYVYSIRIEIHPNLIKHTLKNRLGLGFYPNRISSEKKVIQHTEFVA